MDGEWTVPGYRHLRMLGEGASGRVMQGEHLATGTPVAIKYLSEQLVTDEEFLERFRDEAHLLGDVRDPHLVLFHEYIEGPRGAAIVMELVEGVSLAQLISSEGATQPEAALAVLKGSLLGLAALHTAGIVHRDYKPGNVLIDAAGESKLADVGIAARVGDNVPSAGTPAYMPPEQWGGRPVGPATDVYAATAVFYECLTGQRPYPAKTLPQLALAHRTAQIPVEQVPPPLRNLVRHGLAKDPYDRPMTAEIFLNELEAESLAAYGDDWEERGRNQLKERAALLALLFPISRPVEAGATAIGLSELADGAAKRGRRAGLVAAAGALAIVLLGGGGAIVYAANNSGSPSALPKTSAPAPVDPSGDPSADPSADPSQTPTDSASPSVSPTDSLTPSPGVTVVPTVPVTATSPPVPGPVTTKPKPGTTKPVVKPTPFKVTGVSVGMTAPNSDGVGSFTVTVSTTGSPSQPVTLSFSGDGAKPDTNSVTLSGAPYSYSGSYSGGACRNGTISASASPGGASGSDSYDPSSDPACNAVG